MPTETEETPIDLMRRVVKWADWQREDHWSSEGGRNPTIAQIVALHGLCMKWDVERPEDLESHNNPKARDAYTTWYLYRGA